MFRRHLMLVIAIAFIIIAQGCSSTNDPGTGGSGTGMVSVSLTDAPAYGFDHVWITVRDIWFHTSETAETGQAGWVKFPLSSPITLDLLNLSNGTISVPVWDNIELPEGDYTQIRVFLSRTEASLTASASAEGLTFNNEVDVTNDAAAYALRIPDALRGIRLTGAFQVKKNGKLKLAIDFDAGHDVVKIEHDAATEYILKPRLAYFDLDNAGAVVGSIDTAATGSNAAAQFVFKAEQPGPDNNVHIVRRATGVMDQNGRFILYPLKPGIYDIVMRGNNYETVIVKNVPVTQGTTPTVNPTILPKITMTPASTIDHAVTGSITSPTGAWAVFLQTLPGAGEVPYEIRFRHFNPLTGQFGAFPLSSDPIRVGAYDASSIALNSVSPVEGNGGYKAVAAAVLYDHSAFVSVSSATGTVSFGSLTVAAPATGRSVTGSILLPETFAPGTGFDRGVLFASHGGMIVNAIRVDSQMASGGTYTMQNLPGGTSMLPLPGAFYGIEAMGWSFASPATRTIAVPQAVDLRSNDANGIDLNMVMMP